MENEEIKNNVNNKEEKIEENNSQVEEKLEENKVDSVDNDNVANDETLVEESSVCDNTEVKETSLLKKIFSNVLDQSLIIALSSILLIIFDFLIKFIGYMVVMPLGVLLIIYFIVNSLYSPILKNSKLKKTLGEKVFNI